MNILKKLLLFALLITVSEIDAQQVINYKTGFGSAPDNVSNACNLFNQSTQFTIGTFKHWPVSGGVVRTSDSPIELKTRGGTSTTTTKGTAFAIEYAIKSGYKYSISINAYRISPQNNAAIYVEVAARQALPNPNTDGTDPTACGFVQLSQLTAVQSFKISVNNLTINSENAANLAAVQNWTAPQDRSFFTFLVYGGNNAEDASVFINSITITETAPQPSFTLAASPTSIACGSTAPVTFTATGSNIPNGATVSYNWNLGANNGWLYNGSAVSSTISTGTNNSITLTPDCGKPLSSISATITANGNNYNTSNSASISITSPSYSISGVSSLCSGSTDYALNGTVCGSSIAWVAPPSNLATLSSLTTSPTTLTYGGTSGNFNLTANVTSCGITTPVTLPIHVGGYGSDFKMSSTLSNPPYYCLNDVVTFNISGGHGANYNWSWPAGWTAVSSQGNSYIQLKATGTNPPIGAVSVQYNDLCGNLISKGDIVVLDINCGSAYVPFTVYPNPTPVGTSFLTVAQKLSTYPISRIQIFNPYGLINFDQTYNQVPSAQINIANWTTTGIYVVKILSGGQWYSVKFLLQ